MHRVSGPIPGQIDLRDSYLHGSISDAGDPDDPVQIVCTSPVSFACAVADPVRTGRRLLGRRPHPVPFRCRVASFHGARRNLARTAAHGWCRRCRCKSAPVDRTPAPCAVKPMTTRARHLQPGRPAHPGASAQPHKNHHERSHSLRSNIREHRRPACLPLVCTRSAPGVAPSHGSAGEPFFSRLALSLPPTRLSMGRHAARPGSVAREQPGILTQACGHTAIHHAAASFVVNHAVTFALAALPSHRLLRIATATLISADPHDPVIAVSATPKETTP